MKKSARRNYIYNLIYQIFLLIVPIVLTPYISRVLLPEGVGQYSFANSINTYFTIFAALGFLTYGQREIANKQGDKKAQTIVFWEIVVCRTGAVIVAIAVNLILCFTNVYASYTSLMLIMSINILAVAFDITFFFQGNEDFGKIVVRNVIIRIISIVLIFVFVKEADDLWLYTLIQCAMLLFGNVSLWGYLIKFLCYISLKELKPLRHLKGVIKLFIPTIATQIYVMIDKTLIGVLIQDTYVSIENGVEVIKSYSDLENGYYEQAEKIVKMAMTVVTCMGTVYLPRNSYEVAVGNIDNVKQNVYNSIHFTWMLAIPMVLGFVCIADNFVPWFFGPGYEKCVTLIQLFSPLILIIGFSNLCCYQILAPFKKDYVFIIGSIAGAVINVILNCILIPIMWSYGAVIASLCAEMFVTIFYLICIRKIIQLSKLFLSSIKYFIAGFCMFGILYVVKAFFDSSILNTFLLVIIGMIVYGLCLIILVDHYFMDKIKCIILKLKKKSGD